tara:strand:+ start:639 stop:833 length:195 start_codon:yes stop_codon:yes gene_type:complete
MVKMINLELDIEPDYEERLIYQMVSEMFDVEIKFDGYEVNVFGMSNNVTAWVAFHLLPMTVGEA